VILWRDLASRAHPDAPAAANCAGARRSVAMHSTMHFSFISGAPGTHTDSGCRRFTGAKVSTAVLRRQGLDRAAVKQQAIAIRCRCRHAMRGDGAPTAGVEEFGGGEQTVNIQDEQIAHQLHVSTSADLRNTAPQGLTALHIYLSHPAGCAAP
jgi:hypothetical protein